MAGIATLGTIITEGLDQASNPGPSTAALAWVKGLFHHLYLTQDFEFNLASASVTIASSQISLSGVSRFRNAHVLKLTGISAPLEEKPYKDLWPLIKEAEDQARTGTPVWFCVTPDRSAIVLYPRPDSTYTAGTLLYYKIPDTSSWTTATTPEYEDTLAITEAVTEWAERRDKEPLTVLTQRIAKDLHNRYVNAHEAGGRANQRQLRWGRNFQSVPND